YVLFIVLSRRPHSSPLFPYTTLFRSLVIPVGKDSMSMHTRWRDGDPERAVTAPLSLIVSAFAPVVDVRASVTPQLHPDEDAELRSEEHTSELQSREKLVCRLLLEKKK